MKQKHLTPRAPGESTIQEDEAMKKLRDLRGMPILSLQEGERLGQVRDLIIDPAAGQVVALQLDQRTPGGEPQVVATANVRQVGDAAITVEDRSTLVPLSRIPRFKELARTQKSIRGKLVMTESGVKLGNVADLVVDPQTFRIEGLLLKGFLKKAQSLPAERVRTIGADAVVVRDELPPSAQPVRPVRASAAARPAQSPPAPKPSAVPQMPEEPGALAAELEPMPPAGEMGAMLAGEEMGPEVEPAVPPVSTLPMGVPHAPAEARPPAEPPSPAEAAEESAPAPGPAEPGSEEVEEESAENPWQRWVRRLRHREEG